MLVSWVGFALLQGLNVPSIYYAYTTGQAMPVVSLLMMLGAMACYFYDALKRRYWLHVATTLAGFLGNLTVLLLVTT